MKIPLIPISWGELFDKITILQIKSENIKEKNALKNGVQYLRLDCDANNSKLCNYYESKGFSKIKSISLPLGKYNLYQKKII